MSEQARIQDFLAGKRFAVVGASQDRSKYGNKVLRAYVQHGYDVVPVHPNADAIEGITAVPSLTAIQDSLDGVSIVTPPKVTTQVVKQALALGIKNIWMQPGAESDEAVTLAQSAGANVLAGGPCVLVALAYRER